MKLASLFLITFTAIGCGNSSPSETSGTAGGSSMAGGGGGMSGTGGGGGGGGGSGGAPLTCPSTDLPVPVVFCQATYCGEAAGVDPTPTSNECDGKCSDGTAAQAVCDSGTWTCSVNGAAVSTCKTDDCSASCCFPTGCRHSSGTDVQSEINGSCVGHGDCSGKQVDISCDVHGTCSCTVDGTKLGVCQTLEDTLGSTDVCTPQVGCCTAFLLGC